MATIHWATTYGRHQYIECSPTIPFIILAGGEYAAPINYFLQENSCQRKVDNIKGAKIVEAASPKTERAEGYIALNFINFIEAIKDIPEAQCSGIWSIKNWHHHLWKELMASGHWTREFFASGIPEPINIRRTVRGRVGFIRKAWRWMREEALIAEYIEEMPALLFAKKVQAVRRHFDDIAFAVFGADKKRSKYKKRQNPRNFRVLAREEIRAIIGSANNLTEKLIILLALFVGLRREEIEANSLCPGHLFLRSAVHMKLDQPRFPREAYKLSHSEHDHMVGVMPSIDIAFLPDEKAQEHCTYRIIGKGPKIRRVRVPFKLMRLIWLCYLGERREILKRNRVPKSVEPACFFLDRFGNAYSSNAITRLVYRVRLRAEKRLGVNIKADVHTLRHTYACIYLEAVILGSAARDGYDPERLTLGQIESYGRGAILILKENLGHDELATTEKYLAKLASGKLGLQYQRLFDEAIDPVLTDLK